MIRRNNHAYAAAKRLFDPRFDARSPLAVVEATSAHDVAEAIRFARRFDLAARPRAGGHSYVGASTVDDGLVIDVGRIDGTRYDASSRRATVGAGARLYDVHAALARHGRTIPTGTCPTVGAAGLALGGGLGVDSREHGLTCDRLVSLTIVTADGVIRTVDADQNTDLLWGCRGGGGGNFGVVTSLRFATHPTRRLGFFLVAFPWSAASDLLEGWSRRVRQMPRSSWTNLHLEAGADGSTRARVVGVCQAGDENDEAAAIERAVGVDASSTSTFQRSFLDGIAFLGGGTTLGSAGVRGRFGRDCGDVAAVGADAAAHRRAAGRVAPRGGRHPRPAHGRGAGPGSRVPAPSRGVATWRTSSGTSACRCIPHTRRSQRRTTGSTVRTASSARRRSAAT